MKNLWITLPAYAPDYSGICSAFFDLGGISVVHDASGCTGNYTGYDEPRWFGTRSKVFCSGLREIDAVMGNDEKLLGNLIAAGEDIDPTVYAVIGSPVPMVIGSDMKGIAHELEERTGVPAFGFDTNGLHLYDEGISEALCALIRRFTEKPEETIPGGINVLGTNPLDFANNGNDAMLTEALEDRGYRVMGKMMMGASIDQIRKLASAEVNLVVSVSGFAAAELLERKYGIPYVAGNPVGSSEEVFSLIEQTRADRKSRVITDDASDGILIIGEQITANSLRRAIRNTCPGTGVTVALMTQCQKALRGAGDVVLTDEDSVASLLATGRFHTLIADPLFGELPEAAGLELIPLPHSALSSKLCWDAAPHFIGEQTETIIRTACESAAAAANGSSRK